jgi:K+/H+ antiporter YhaU regulatory subunit KhtT
LSTTTEQELENRLHSLTESLIQKQTLIEALQSEKHSLFLQLERSEKRLEDYENIMNSRKNTIINFNDDDTTNQKQNQIFNDSPYDNEAIKKVKRAVSEIDKFSIRLGVFLKRYPIARVFIIIYMVIKAPQTTSFTI